MFTLYLTRVLAITLTLLSHCFFDPPLLLNH